MNISERFQVEASRPKVTNTVNELKYKNSYTKYKGPTKFENISMKFRDVVGPAVMQKLWAWQREHYDPVTGCGGYPSQYKKNLVLVMEDDCGNPVQKWLLYGCFIASLDGGSLNMKEQVIKTLLEDEYYKAVLNAQNAINSQTPFDIAEMYAQGAINENPQEEDAANLSVIAVRMIVQSWGYIPQQ
jgi:hypothetical protein